MSRRKRNRFKPDSRPAYWQQESYNQWLLQMFIDDITELAMSRFKWVNLPETCDARYLEWTLLHEGCATIAHPVKHPDRILTLKAVQQDAPNMYDEPKKWMARGQTGRTRFAVNWLNGCWIWDNPTRFPLMVKISMWARELADIMQVKHVNRFHMRAPLYLTGAQEKVLDMTNLYRQMADGEPVTIGYDSLATDIDLKMALPEKSKEYLGDKLDADYEQTWNHIYRMLGIDSLPYKEERMIEDEVSSQMEPTEMSKIGPLECRRAAVRRFNLIHGTDIDVVWNTDVVSSNWRLAHDRDMQLQLTGGDADATV